MTSKLVCLNFTHLSVITLFFLLLSLDVTAQYTATSVSEVVEIKKRILIVGLEEEDKAILIDLEVSKEKISNYRATIEGKNAALKNAVDSFWEFTAEVIYKPFSEAKKIFKKEKNKYAFLHYGEEIASGRLAYGFMGSDQDPNSYGYMYKEGQLKYDYRSRTSMKSYNVFTLLIELPSSNAITIYLSKSCPSETDVQLALLQMQYTFKYLLENPSSTVRRMMLNQLPVNALELKNKTLLLDATDFMSRFTKAEIAEVYPHPFKLVDYKEIERVVTSKDTNAVVINFGRYNDDERLFYILNAGNGKIYSSFINLAYPVMNSLGSVNTIYYPGVRLTDIEKIVD